MKIYELNHKNGEFLGIYRPSNSHNLFYDFYESHIGDPILDDEIEHYGEDYQNIDVTEHNSSELMKSPKLNLNDFSFSLWIKTEHKDSWHREIIANCFEHISIRSKQGRIDYYLPFWLKDILRAKDIAVLENIFGQESSKYLRELAFNGSYKDVFDRLNKIRTDTFSIGALNQRLGFAYDPISAKTWLQWYDDNVIPAIDDKIKKNELLDRYPLIEYPFPGIDLYHELKIKPQASKKKAI